jgi:hypothetical protein
MCIPVEADIHSGLQADTDFGNIRTPVLVYADTLS